MREHDFYTRPDWPHSAVITIDVQRDFVTAASAACIPGAAEVIPAVSRVVRAFRATDRPIVHIVRLYSNDGSNVDFCRRARIEAGSRIVEPGSDGSHVVEELLPAGDVRLDADLLLSGEKQKIGEHEWIIYKPRWGAFYKTPLAHHLAELKVNTIVFLGINFPNCPRTTIYQASERDFRIVVVKDAVSGLYDRALDELIGIGATITKVDELLGILSSFENLEA
jgi:nicotinamidase-related amidase